MQIARYLIDEALTKEDSFDYDDSDRVLSFGVGEEELARVINLGVPFMTSGCPDDTGLVACNRPYGDSMPGPDIRSFPFLPEEEDLVKIRTELKTY
jgi:biotin synthase